MKPLQTSHSARDEDRFDELLPWYVNGTLDAAGRAWIETQAEASPKLAALLRAELGAASALRQATAQATATTPDEDDQDHVMLLARIRAERAHAAPPRRARQAPQAPAAWMTSALRPTLFAGMAAALCIQAGVIVWMAVRPGQVVGTLHSEVVTEMRTLRVTFKPEASETQIRTLLVGASARIVGGPTQLGEYWVASATRSLDDMRASLLRSSLVATIEVDRVGPQGQ